MHTVPLRRGPPPVYARRLQSHRSKAVSTSSSAREDMSFFALEIDEACVLATILECIQHMRKRLTSREREPKTTPVLSIQVIVPSSSFIYSIQVHVGVEEQAKGGWCFEKGEIDSDVVKRAN